MGGQTNRPTDGLIPIYPPKLHLRGGGFVICAMQLHVYERKYMSHLHLIFFSLGLGEGRCYIIYFQQHVCKV